MDRLALNLNNSQQRNGKTLNFENHGRLLYCGVRPRAQLHYIRLATRAGRESNVPRFPELWWPVQQQLQWTLQRAGWPVVTPVVDTSLAFPPKLMRTRSPTHPPCIVLSPTLPIPPYFIFAGMFYLLVCFRATTNFDRKHINQDVMKWYTCPEVMHLWIKHLIWATKYGVEFWIRPPEFPIFWVLKTGTFAVFLKSMNETLTQNQNMTTAILVCCKFHLILRWLYITLNTNITIFK